MADVAVTPPPAPPPGDFFRSPLPPADLYVLARVLHDWADAACVELLRRVRGALRPGGRGRGRGGGGARSPGATGVAGFTVGGPGDVWVTVVTWGSLRSAGVTRGHGRSPGPR